MQRRGLPFILGDIAKIDLAGEARPSGKSKGRETGGIRPAKASLPILHDGV